MSAMLGLGGFTAQTVSADTSAQKATIGFYGDENLHAQEVRAKEAEKQASSNLTVAQPTLTKVEAATFTMSQNKLPETGDVKHFSQLAFLPLTAVLALLAYNYRKQNSN